MQGTSFQPQFVFVTDSGLLKPSLVAMFGVLRHLSGIGTIHFWGHNLSPEGWAAVKRVASTNPDVDLQCYTLGTSDLAGAKGPSKHISPATMGRLYIPSKLTGRVLYLDGDIQVVGDLAPLFSLDLQGKPVGAVRDFVVSKWSAVSGERKSQRLDELRKLLGQEDVSRYFNAGVLLMDTDAIRAESKLFDAFSDVVRASSFPTGDQDYLNLLLHDQVHMLNPAYNSSWGRTGTQRKFAGNLGGSAEEIAPVSDVVIHFHGPRKPWVKRRLDLLSMRAPAVWKYRRDLSAFRQDHPDLTP